MSDAERDLACLRVRLRVLAARWEREAAALCIASTLPLARRLAAKEAWESAERSLTAVLDETEAKR